MFAIKSSPVAPGAEGASSPLQSGLLMAAYFGGLRLVFEFFQSEAGQSLIGN
jgi:hypothetical protein